MAAGDDPRIAQRRASDPAHSVWVGASAGTGKTKVLTDRVLRLMLAGTPVPRILCLTFTKAAAAEMANRLATTLAGWATAGDADLVARLTDLTGMPPGPASVRDARRLFARVVDCPGGLKIQTIHAFCQSLLRRFPLEAGLAPNFDVMDERTASEQLAEAELAVFAAARADPTAPLGRALRHLTADNTPETFGKLLAEVSGERGRLARILAAHDQGAGDGGLGRAIAAVYRTLDVAVEDAGGADDPGAEGDAADRVLVAAACRDDAVDRGRLAAAAAALAAGTATDQERGAAITAWLELAPEARAHRFDAYARAFLTNDGDVRKRLVTKQALKVNPDAEDALRREAERLVAVAERRAATAAATATAALLTVAAAVLAAYEARKRARARLDYDDLVLIVCALLERPGVAPWVLFKLDGGLDHILIDEAQDTNPDQWQVVARLAEEFFAGAGVRATARTVFAVGDEKQSIFSFQRADPAAFRAMRRHFADRVRLAQQDWETVDLDTSFRSTPAVLSVVDAVFGDPRARDGVADDRTVIRHRPFRAGQAGLVELWPLVEPEAREDAEPWALPVSAGRAAAPSARLAVALAETVRGWLEGGERLPARDRAVRPGDILVLVRRRTAFVAELVRALKERRIPVAGVDRMVLTDQLAVMDLVAFAEVLLLPEDDLTLAAVLKGPLIGLDEAALFTLAHGRSGRLWEALATRAAAAGADPLVAAAYGYLAAWRGRADLAAPYELLAGVLHGPCPADPAGSGLRALLGRLGPDARDPIDELVAAALTFQRGHPPSLQGFLAWLASGRTEIKREQDPGDDAGDGSVRVMTVHGAKGLQAPIVILPDMTAVPQRTPRILWPEGGRTVPLVQPRRDREPRACAEARGAAECRRDQEYRRLLYVALTRAEDRLTLCGWRGAKAPPGGSWYSLVAGALADDAVARPFAFAVSGADGWQGEGRRLVIDQSAAPRPDRPSARAAAAPPPLPGWASAPPAAEPDPPRPLVPSRPEDDDPPVRSPLGSDDGRRFRRGLIIHRLLQTLPELPVAARADAARRWVGRASLGLASDQQDEVVAETLAVLATPELCDLFGPGSRAEVPVAGLVAGRAVSGQIDRVLVTADRVTIADYKTLRPPPATEAEVPVAYLRQMALYRATLAEIYPDRAVVCVIVWTDGPRVMPLSAMRLDAIAPRPRASA